MRLTLAPGLGRGSGFDAEARRGGEKRGGLTTKGGTSAETAEAGGLRSGAIVARGCSIPSAGRAWGRWRWRGGREGNARRWGREGWPRSLLAELCRAVVS